ncbi:MAG: hypothetical protein B6245_00880 [Desulfobacteraceae bacterium 4572_88]|nr:MAG: hypothetical protein B6245_00880 [Desulfobacteraceae bacterium 4572_88]RLC20452.1 MAG: hypothetical protein DRI57_04780 [Deltaproteobacteria bacterium]
MKKNLLFCALVLSALIACRENSANDEKTLQLLTEISTQQSELVQQVKANAESLKKLEGQNQKLQKLVEHQRALLNRRLGTSRNASSPRHVSRMIEAMSRTQPPSKVAEMLNRKKVPNPKGGMWTAEDVQGAVAKNRPSGKTEKEKSRSPKKTGEQVTKEK